ncbi:ArsR family transcriptional regulator [Guptibacillus algicola]|uniref:ArsR family transcriptional regulator n=1 Tax=Guptibacillus algicola TaxID=225844 RepID=UPI001CD75BCC|nr:ArsR family transcriptional regulator [Alkalihalobacillus algicola]MCA0988580.1 ArsR family transcriptional regulator [Alkalihalobacillus algicola]
MINSVEVAKALFDPKLNSLIKCVETESKTVKEMAAELNEKPSRLYYPIQKLMKLELLKVEREETIGNLIEKYYTSNHLVDQNMSMEGEFARENKEFLLTQVMTSIQRGVEVLRKDLEADPTPDHSSATYRQATASLTLEEWQELNEEIIELINKRQSSSSHAKRYSFSFLSYEADKK